MRSVFPFIMAFFLFLAPAPAGAAVAVDGDPEKERLFEQMVWECAYAVRDGNDFGAKKDEDPFLLCVIGKGIHKLGLPGEDQPEINPRTQYYTGGNEDETGAPSYTGQPDELQSEEEGESDAGRKAPKPIFLGR